MTRSRHLNAPRRLRAEWRGPETKKCRSCGETITRESVHAEREWLKKAYCSPDCQRRHLRSSAVGVDGEGGFWLVMPGPRACRISPEDVELADSRSWRIGRGGYVQADGVLFHRAVLVCPAGTEVDHVNRDRLDNRRENLRFATDAINRHNSLRKHALSGVRFRKNRYEAQLCVGRRTIYLGRFLTIEEARAARAAAEREHRGYTTEEIRATERPLHPVEAGRCDASQLQAAALHDDDEAHGREAVQTAN